jgi:ABC-type sugar transport system ATPase subunit
MNPALLELKAVTKAFPGVIALDEVDFALRAGEIHAVVGKNGAGKSTLISIISGIYQPDRGEVYFEDQKVPFHSLRTLPTATVYQESALFQSLSIADNICCGEEPTSVLAFLDDKEKNRQTREYLQMFDLRLEPGLLVAQLSPAEQKVVEILRAIRRNCRVLILDEPTATLTGKETNRLFELLKKFLAANIGIIYISHRLEEIFQIADRVSVLRDGRLQACEEVKSLDLKQLVALMVGKQAESLEKEAAGGRADAESAAPILRLEALSHAYGRFRDVSLSVGKGEILGLVGLVGAGKTELARTVFGLDRLESGTIFLNGSKLAISGPKDAIRHGILYVTESRKTDGLFLEMSLRDNVAAPVLSKISGAGGFLQSARMKAVADQAIAQFDVKTTGSDQVVNTLSGGNQQKVLLGIWLQLEPKVLIVDEPTVGIDVAAKAEIYRLLRRIAATGTAIILISSETKEILLNCDRILTMYKGRIVAEFLPDGASEKKIFEQISGITEGK